MDWFSIIWSMKKPMDKWTCRRWILGIGIGCLALVSLPLAGCALPASSNYPEIPLRSDGQQASAPSLSEPSTTTAPDDGLTHRQRVTLRVAGPWQADQLDLLGRYYELTQNQVSTLGHEDSRGSHISLDYLSAYDSDLRLVAEPLPQAEFLTDELARIWTAAGTWPDLVLTDHYSALQASQLLDLTSYLMDDKRLAADKVSPALLSDSQSPQGFLYLPWRLSVPVLLYHPRSVPDAVPGGFEERPTWPEFVEQCHQLVAGSDATQLAIANPEALVTVLVSGTDAHTGWAGWNGSGYDFSRPEFISTVQALRHLVAEGATGIAASIGYPDYVATTQDKLDGHQVAYQVIDSSQLATLDSGRPDHLVLPLPSTAATKSPYPVRVQALSVSKSTGQPGLACQVAAFLAADPDALFLQNRLSPQPGLFPIVRDREVWTAYLDPISGRTGALEKLPDLLDHPAPGGAFKVFDWPAVQRELAGPSAYRLLAEPDVESVIQSMQQAWDQREEG